ncbi:hypothetical protein JOC54_004152 [Alkalihalobacillus xiaoxiensis]|uniref:Uncharacterized protein n=1 Tax=Shouchella xiaoxiensis TaxID=766895 RepID=A0ABS2SZA1_9BACI|nr:DUF2521 family protein [Shouchella xiaoxiensis]MBM7840859.1 hypothetical protein [Shouchella xiaoxiensis]
MGFVVSMMDKSREKKWNFERKMLRNINIRTMETNIKEWIRPVMPFHFQSYPFLMDQCLDMTIDAYLLGADFGRFGYYGEPVRQAKQRCFGELTELSHSLCAALSGWNQTDSPEHMLIATDMLLDHWWEKGFLDSCKAHKLRLQ